MDLLTTLDAGGSEGGISLDGLDLLGHGSGMWILGCLGDLLGAEVDDLQVYLLGTLESSNLACLEHAVQHSSRLAWKLPWQDALGRKPAAVHGFQLWWFLILPAFVCLAGLGCGGLERATADFVSGP